MDDGAAKRKIEKFILPLALIFPLALMTANLTYDEFWSLIRFAPLGAGEILTDLSLPNNHPLNTLFLKLLSPVSPAPLLLRLPSLLCGAAVPLLCGELAYRRSN